MSFKPSAVIQKLFSATALLMFSGLLWAEEKTEPAISSASYSPVDQMIKMMLGLVVVVGLIFAVAWVARNYFGVSSSASAELKAIAGVAVGHKERVVLLQVGERQVLVGVAPGQVNMLQMLDKEDEIKSTSEDKKNLFAEKFKQSVKGLEKQ